MTLSDRGWSCDASGVIHDRDRNDASNLRLAAESSLTAASLSERTGSDVGPMAAVKPASAKRESKRETFVYA
jgi:transposase